MDYKQLPDLSLFHDHIDIQLRFNDVDVLGHVNNTAYFSFYDLAKTHWFHNALHQEMEIGKIETVIANIECAFMRQILFTDKIEVLTRCIAIYDKSYRLQQVIRDTVSHEIKSMCETVMVCFDPATGRTHTVPERWRIAAEKFEGRNLQQHNS